MNIVITYLYGSLEYNIYIKILEWYKIYEICNSKFWNIYSIKIERCLYGLNQFGGTWYNHLNEYLIKQGFINSPLCPYAFIKKSNSWFAIITIYVDYLNLIGT